APVLRQFDGSALQLSLVLVELGFEALEQGERVGRRARKAGEHAIVVDAANLARGRLDDDVAERDLAVAAKRDLCAAAHGKYRRTVKEIHCRMQRSRCGCVGADARRKRSRRAMTSWEPLLRRFLDEVPRRDADQ